MKALVTIGLAFVLVVSVAGMACAYETDFDDLYRTDRHLPSWKLGRGVMNLIALPHELFNHMINYSIVGAREGAADGALQGYWAGAINGYISGFFPGLYAGLKRMTTGALEILTFWKPEYGPTIEPIYGSRSKTFGPQDYGENSFWYFGPDAF